MFYGAVGPRIDPVAAGLTIDTLSHRLTGQARYTAPCMTAPSLILTHGELAQHLRRVRDRIGQVTAEELRIYQRDGAPPRIALRLAGPYDVVLHDTTGGTYAPKLPAVVHQHVFYPLDGGNDLQGKRSDQPDQGLRLSARSARQVEALTRPQVAGTVLVLSVCALLACVVLGILLSVQVLAVSDDNLPAPTHLALIGLLGLLWEYTLARTRQHRLAEYEEVTTA